MKEKFPIEGAAKNYQEATQFIDEQLVANDATGHAEFPNTSLDLWLPNHGYVRRYAEYQGFGKVTRSITDFDPSKEIPAGTSSVDTRDRDSVVRVHSGRHSPEGVSVHYSGETGFHQLDRHENKVTRGFKNPKTGKSEVYVHVFKSPEAGKLITKLAIERIKKSNSLEESEEAKAA